MLQPQDYIQNQSNIGTKPVDINKHDQSMEIILNNDRERPSLAFKMIFAIHVNKFFIS